jgi:hypothetical protein
VLSKQNDPYFAGLPSQYRMGAARLKVR